MIKSILKVSLLGLLAIAVTGTPIMLRAQDASTTTATNKPPTPRALPFRGKVMAIDNTAMTITVGTRPFQITSQTKITKDGKPATFGDGAVGDNVTGTVKRGADGKWNAVTIKFGTKPKPAAPSNAATNAPNSP